MTQKLILASTGACSFCGMGPPEVRGLAAAPQNLARICEGCLGLCFDVVGAERPSTLKESDDRPEFRSIEILSPDDAKAAAAAIGWDDEPRRSRGQPLACSFCSKSKGQVEKLVAGAAANICAECVMSAGAVFSSMQPEGLPE